MIGEIFVVGGLTEAQSVGNGIVSLIIAVIIVVHTAMAGEKKQKNKSFNSGEGHDHSNQQEANQRHNDTDLQNTNTTSSLIKKTKKTGLNFTEPKLYIKFC